MWIFIYLLVFFGSTSSPGGAVVNMLPISIFFTWILYCSMYFCAISYVYNCE